jgi:hypothetical protein
MGGGSCEGRFQVAAGWDVEVFDNKVYVATSSFGVFFDYREDALARVGV